MLERALRITAISAAVLAVAGIALYSCAATRTPPAMVGAIVAPGGVALELSDEQSAKDQVMIERILAPAASWVVVTAFDAPGSEGSRVGLTHVGPRETLDLRVPLEPGASSSQRLSVALHVDRGVIGRFEFDPERFDASPDKPYFVDGTGLSVVVTDTPVYSLARSSGAGAGDEVAAASGTAVLEVAERLMALNGLTIGRVVAPSPSWVAIYLVGTDGRSTALAGSARVPAGESAGVRVEIGPGVAVTKRVLVVLHSDTGVSGRFEFDPARFAVGHDRPYAVDGVEVSRPVFLRNYLDVDGSGGM